jgi:hypothetical protein
MHVEREDWRAAPERKAMVRRSPINELAVAWRLGQQHPTGAAAKRLAHRDEFGAPAFVRSEISRLAQRST